MSGVRAGVIVKHKQKQRPTGASVVRFRCGKYTTIRRWIGLGMRMPAPDQWMPHQ